jgi:predicted peptidase
LQFNGIHEYSLSSNHRVLAPQCPPHPAFWAPIEKWTEKEHPFSPKPTPAMVMVMSLLDDFIQSHPVDASRIYLIGPSMGGYGAWDLLARMPERFAAAVPCCGGLADGQSSKIAKVPLWIFHGGADEIVRVEYSRSAFAQLKAAGGKPRYSEFAEGPHRVSVYVWTSSALMDWLFAQKR